MVYMASRVAVIVPTLNAGSQFIPFLTALMHQSTKTDAIIIDSSSDDETAVTAKKFNLNLIRIARDDFNHGGTRQMGVNQQPGIDFVVFLTQDAILSAADSVECLLKYFDDLQVAAVCGRQLPAESASPIEAHARVYNYGAYVRSITDKGIYGLKTAFLSNSFAAYRVSALNLVGGFPDNVIFGEDMYVAAKLLKAGYKVAYAADACVYHSHNYLLSQDLKRYFDMGVFHAREPWIRREFGAAEREGLKFVSSELKYLAKHAFWRIPESLLRIAIRLTGFRLGLWERHIPLKIKRKMSMNPRYFKNK